MHGAVGDRSQCEGLQGRLLMKGRSGTVERDLGRKQKSHDELGIRKAVKEMCLPVRRR